ncbi:hypothetical protein R5R35_000143 [Gryllus longicercus]|uniref:C2H2-type domain-containing protein n=1 Tax=Gryllus longicercus TaxID=2509291 RepID=A0AAN9VB27_9ORTH
MNMNSLLDNDSAVAEEMDSLMLHSDIGEEFEESTEAMLKSILRVDVVQLGQEDDDDFADEYTSSYRAPVMPITPLKTLKKSRKCNCGALNSTSKDKRNKKCTCDASSDASESPRRPTARKKRSKGLFECDMCERSFVQLALLEVHKKQHQESKSSLSAHLRAKPLGQPVVQQGDLTCDGCKLAFISFCGKLKHCQTLHPESVVLAENGQAKSIINVISQDTTKTASKTPVSPSKTTKTLLKSVSQEPEEKKNDAFDRHISRDEQSLRDVEILFSVDVENLLNNPDDDLPEDANKNLDEDFDPFGSVVLYSGDENDCGDGLDYEGSREMDLCGSSEPKTSENNAEEELERPATVFLTEEPEDWFSEEEELQGSREMDLCGSSEPKTSENNAEEDIDPLGSVVLYTGDENDCGDGLDYEFVSQADAYAACNFLENPDSLHEIEEAEAEDRASR